MACRGQPNGGLRVCDGVGGVRTFCGLPLAPRTQMWSNVCMPTPDLDLPPHLAPDHTCWALGDMTHVGAYEGPYGWEVLHLGPGFQHAHGIYPSREVAEVVAELLAPRLLAQQAAA